MLTEAVVVVERGRGRGVAPGRRRAAGLPRDRLVRLCRLYLIIRNWFIYDALKIHVHNTLKVSTHSPMNALVSLNDSHGKRRADANPGGHHADKIF